ncbi:MAG: PTS sugar transporter subunit IIA [Lentisphaeria bacterium]|nr:PTS sugar transporter subunit IIA [Lentisphaeria bacterium]
MKISEYLNPSLIKLNLESLTKEELFPEMVQLFVKNGLVKDAAAAVRILEEREEKMSTGVGNGIGLPHGKLPEAKQSMLALGISRDGIEYDSLDGEPVYIVIAIFANPENPSQHIEVLAEISRLFAIPEFSMRVRAAKSAQEVLDIIAAQE